jgi:hypothetical protein
MVQLVPIVAIIGFFSSIMFIAYLYFNHKHKVRMALIESGRDASIFRQENDRSQALKYGLVAVGLGLGLMVGSALETLGFEEPLPQFSMMLILGGAALLLYYFIEGRQKDESQRDML